jgi:hypothetical protein
MNISEFRKRTVDSVYVATQIYFLFYFLSLQLSLLIDCFSKILHFFESSLCFVEFIGKLCVWTISMILYVWSSRRPLERFRLSCCCFELLASNLKEMQVFMYFDLKVIEVLLLSLNFLHFHLIVIQNIIVECLKLTFLFLNHLS